MAAKYTKEILEDVVKQSVSFSGVLRLLGVRQAGGSQSHITRIVNKFEIDHSHFTGQKWFKGGVSHKRKTAKEILVFHKPSLSLCRTQSHQLRRALLQIGRLYECEECKIGNTYNHKPLVLEIDHKNGLWNDDQEENLRFLCPNCHSQTLNYGSKNICFGNTKAVCLSYKEETCRFDSDPKYQFHGTVGELE